MENEEITIPPEVETVSLDEVETDLAPGFSYNDDDPNLVTAFDAHRDGKAALKKISEQVLDDFAEDWEGSSERRRQIEMDTRIFTGNLPAKDFPFQNCANAHVPIMLTNIQRLQCRIESEVFGDWTSVAAVVPVGPGDEDVAEILTQHLTWQLREQIPDFERQCKRGVQMYLVSGDVVCHSYWDPFKRQNVHEMLTPDEFVLPFTFVSTSPNLSDVDHYTKVIRYKRHQLQAHRDRWVGIDEVLDGTPAAWGDDPDMPLREGMADVQGEAIPTDLSKKAPFVLLHYEGWFDLPNQKRDRWCQAIVDKATKRVLSFTIHEETNWQDRIRYEQQSAEMDTYRMGMAAHLQAVDTAQQQMGLVDSLQGGLGPQQTQGLLGAIAPPPPPPPPPSWLADPNDLEAQPEPPKKDPIYLFAHAVAIEPVSGAYGLSYGRILADYNRAANVALSQFVDAATLANSSPLVVAAGVEFDRPFSWGPGKINKVKGVMGAELKDSIMPLTMPAANAQLLQLVELMGVYGQDAAQSPEVLSGNPGKSGETYRGIATRIDQAVKNLTVIGRSIAAFVQTILQNNAKLNATFLREEEIFQVTHGTLQYMGPMTVTREMYQRDYKVRIVSDLQFQGDQERIAEADQILQMWAAFPPLQANSAFGYAAIKRCLEARHQRPMVPMLGAAPPPPPPVFGMMPMAPPGAPGAPPPGGGPPGPPPANQGPPPANHPQGPGGPAPGAPPPPQPAQAA